MLKKEYTNGEIAIVWQAEKCIHAGICVKTLPQVYNPKERPWIKPANASSVELIQQVSQCPSGALRIKEDLETIVKIEREDNGRKGRFVIYADDQMAGEMTFVWAGKSKFIIDHTGVGENFSGKGYGKKLVIEAVEYARKNDLKILPLCPFAKKVFDRDPGLGDVLT